MKEIIGDLNLKDYIAKKAKVLFLANRNFDGKEIIGYYIYSKVNDEHLIRSSKTGLDYKIQPETLQIIKMEVE